MTTDTPQTDTDTFSFTRRYALSPAQVWHLVTDAEQRAQWAVPDPSMTLTTLSSDLCLGGTDHHRCGPADAPEFDVVTRWYNIDAPTNAVFTETIMAGGAHLGASLVTCHIAADGGGSALHLTVAVSSFVGAEMIGEFRAGWTGGMANLDRMARTMPDA